MRNNLFLLFILSLLKASYAAKHYSEGDTLDVYANIVGPYGNPSETYQYYTLPLCAPRTKRKEKLLNLGEVLAGHRLVQGPYNLKFKVPVESATLCSRYMSAGDIDQFRDAIIRDYYFQLMLDGDLPVWGFLGKVKRSTAEIATINATDTDADTEGHDASSSLQSPHRLLLFTHLHFHLLWNGDRVIQCDLSTTSDSAVDITNGVPQTIEFTYSVSWNYTSIPFSKRKERYDRYRFLPEHVELHWFSIANSVATVLVLTGVLLLIFVRVLRADVARYIDIENADAKDVGWKALHADVFRPPPGKSILSAAVGVGSQVLLIVTMILCLGIAGHNRPYRGALLASMVILYVLTSGIAGYMSGRTYRALNGDRWVGNCLMVNFLICGPLFIVFSILNTIAWAYGSTAALPFGTIVIILLLWSTITLPLTFGGAMLALKYPSGMLLQSRMSKSPRPIPAIPWYKTLIPNMALAGFLPFAAIYVELHLIFASVWGYKVYTIYTVLAVMFPLLILVTSFVTIALLYFQLMAEDWRWWWRSFLSGGSTGMYIYMYAFYFFYFKSSMGGLMQVAFYFGYCFIGCYAVFLMLGAVGWISAMLFVRRIFVLVKSE